MCFPAVEAWGRGGGGCSPPPEVVCCQGAARASSPCARVGPGGRSRHHLRGREKDLPAAPSLWGTLVTRPAPPRLLTLPGAPPSAHLRQAMFHMSCVPRRNAPPTCPTRPSAWMPCVPARGRRRLRQARRGGALEFVCLRQRGRRGGEGAVACSRRPLPPPVPPPKFWAAAACAAHSVTRRPDRHRLDRPCAWSPDSTNFAAPHPPHAAGPCGHRGDHRRPATVPVWW